MRNKFYAAVGIVGILALGAVLVAGIPTDAPSVTDAAGPAPVVSASPAPTPELVAEPAADVPTTPAPEVDAPTVPAPSVPAPTSTPAPALECPAGTVPGWLGEDGLPTSCVNDSPCVEWRELGYCLADVPAGPVYTIAPCPTEDSANCYWDATTRGNRSGESFVNLNGHTYYTRS